MNDPKLLITGECLEDSHFAILRQSGLSIYHRRDHLDAEALVTALDGAKAYILGGVEQATRPVLERCPKLRLIAVLGVGYSSFVDNEAATKLGIAVTNTPDTNTVSVAELTIGHILNLRRQITSFNNLAKQGMATNLAKTSDLTGVTVGIIGMGAIGSCVAGKLRHGFGVRIIYNSRRPKPEVEHELGALRVSLGQLLDDSDIVIVMTPTTPETVGLIGERELDRMRDTALLINTAGARLVDGHALFDALTRGVIAGAAFDGYYLEPVPPPDRDEYRLLSLKDDRFILTPHTGALTHSATKRMSDKAVRSVISFLESGDDQYIVNPEYRKQAQE